MLQTFRIPAILAAAVLGFASTPADAQFHEKREAKIAESEKPQNVKGGTTFQIASSYEKAYDGTLNHFKREGYVIDSAGKETGQIVTAMDVKGGYTQTGTRVLVTCIKDSDTQTSIRVVVTIQKRKKLLQAEPWGDARADDAQSTKIAEQIRSVLGQ